MAPTLSLVLGAAAVLVVFRLVERRLDRRRAVGAVALLCCFVSAPVLQTAYTESLALLLVATTLLLLSQRRYLWALVPVLLLGLTRNIALVLLPVVLVHWLVREHDHRRGAQAPGRLRLAVLAVSTVVATGEWPALVGVRSGDASAYFTTIQAWPGFSGSALRPPWAAALTDAGITAWLAAVILLVLLALALLSRPVRRWGPELWAWTGAVVGFVVLTTSASTSIARYLLLAFPLGLVLMPDTESASARRVQHVTVVAACAVGLVAQYLWVDKILVYAGPGGGWGFP